MATSTLPVADETCSRRPHATRMLAALQAPRRSSWRCSSATIRCSKRLEACRHCADLLLRVPHAYTGLCRACVRRVRAFGFAPTPHAAAQVNNDGRYDDPDEEAQP